MTAQPTPPAPHRAHPHRHAERPFPITLLIPLTVMPAHAGIPRLGSCGVGS